LCGEGDPEARLGTHWTRLFKPATTAPSQTCLQGLECLRLTNPTPLKRVGFANSVIVTIALEHSWPQQANEGQIPIPLSVVQTIAYDKAVGEIKTLVADRYVD